MPDVEHAESSAGSNEAEMLHEQPGETNVNSCRSHFRPKENLLRAFRQHNKSHRPRHNSEHHAKANPPQKSHGSWELRRIEYRHYSRGKRQGGNQAGTRQEQADLRLLVDKPIAFLIVPGDCGEPG